ncbi:NUMOD3 domain-containing DNA-binding protein [Aliifodinibius sp. S!AR15-10]|uniref:NUMOD3 domain-containing DNA-binding protein n=1 Tax=Aliifodinibius sp. S!AR15-10 TaxID=2950437 RepID=UPI00285B12D0|nr:NUMOD3 domain-containing DNA-binding protein [Aliifodinibius sp. S!AR15-10]MDR8390991.1 NUMOD3 domain-containing DNA-binding protein [Aliifodinibius sp. S!AR15-10]
MTIKYYIYKIIDRTTDKFYIGCRKCEGNPENDNYMGSYSDNTWQPNTDNLEKQILGIFTDKVEAYQLEEVLINKCRERFDNCVNGKPYSYKVFLVDKSGEKSYWYGKNIPKEVRIKLSEAHKGKKLSEEHKEKISETLKGRKFAKKTIQKMSEARKEWHKNNDIRGSNNPNATKVRHVKTDKIFDSQKEAAEYFDISASSVLKHCKEIYQTQKFEYVK